MSNLPRYSDHKTAIVTILLCLILSAAFAFKIFRDEPACAIALDRENVFYLGVDNPVAIVARGVPAEQLIIKTSDGLSIQKEDGDNYAVRASTEGTETITVSGGDLEPATFRYRVKRIPDPVPTLFNYKGERQNGIAAVLHNFDYEVKCEVQSYDVTYLPKRQDAVTRKNNGARFGADVTEFIQKAKPGDAYFFDNIMVLCPGDTRARNLGGLAYKIK